MGTDAHPAAIDVFSKLINASSRPIVLSLSPGDSDPALLRQTSNMLTMARITTDFHPNWPAVLASFPVAAAAAPVAHANNVLADLDCLAFGDMNGRSENTQDEWRRTRRTIMTLWTISRSPLMFGGDPRSLWNSSSSNEPGVCVAPDNITFHCGLHDDVRELITNRGVLNASDDVLAPAQLRAQGDIIIWSANSASSSRTKYVAMFNAPTKASSGVVRPTISVTPADLKLPATKLDVFELLNGTSQRGVGSVTASPLAFDAAFFRVVVSGSEPSPGPAPPPSGFYRCENDTCVPCGKSGGTKAECMQVCGPP